MYFVFVGLGLSLFILIRSDEKLPGIIRCGRYIGFIYVDTCLLEF